MRAHGQLEAYVTGIFDSSSNVSVSLIDLLTSHTTPRYSRLERIQGILTYEQRTLSTKLRRIPIYLRSTEIEGS